MTTLRRVRLILLPLYLSPTTALSCEDISATNAWIKEPPPVARVAAGYVELKHSGRNPVTIEKIESSCCAKVLMHETVADGDHVHMSHVRTLELAPDDVISFVPGGRHLMLMDPTAPLVDGAVVELEFFCTGGGSFRTDFDIVNVR